MNGAWPSYVAQPWPERSGPREIGIHHAGAELEPAKGDSLSKAIVACRVCELKSDIKSSQVLRASWPPPKLTSYILAEHIVQTDKVTPDLTRISSTWGKGFVTEISESIISI